MKHKKLVLTLFLEIVFTIIVIYLLFYSRDKTRSYLLEVQEFSKDIPKIQEELGKQSLTTYDSNNIQSKLDDVEKVLDKAIILNQVIIPLVLLLLSVIFYSLIWKLSSSIEIKYFIIYSLLPLLLLFFAIIQFLNYLSFLYLEIGNNNIVLLSFSVFILIVVYYFNLVLLSKQNLGFVKALNLAINNFRKIIFPYISMLLSSLILLFLILIIFVMSFAGNSIIIPSIILFFLLIFTTFQRLWFIKKISKI